MKRPDSLNTVDDCRALAEYEWANDEVDHKLWKNKAAYVEPRAAHLAGRLKPPVATKGRNADRTEPEQHDPGEP